jgi:aminomethyltransferase
MTLKRTPLYDFHVALNATMVPFGGWEMPVQYDSILQEHGVTRRRTAVFDICHMGELIVEGDPAASGLDRLVTQRLRDLPCGACRYGAMLNENGGVIDDLIVFRMDAQRWMLVVNAACADKDAAHLQRHLAPDARLQDVSAATGKIDVQGPGSRELLAGLVPEVGRLAYYTLGTFDVLGEKAVVSRTGYTGELGYEIYFPWDRTPDLWTRLLDAGAQPAGLGARDILRLEMGYPLYGHEMTEAVCALESGMGRFIDWEKDFIGKSALLKYKEKGLQKKLMCFAAESRQSPRAHQKIFSPDTAAVGEVTSGAFSPALGRGIGMGFVPPEYQEGRMIFFGQEGKMVPAQIVSRPVYKDGSLKF